jgi:tetratricopeptide (TPR) repeat protein
MVEGRLLRGSEVVPLRHRALALLHHLSLHPNRLVTKDELLAAVWPGVSVSEIVLAVCVSELRKGLGDSAKVPRFIETVHGRGYRFIATVGAGEGPSDAGPRARCPVVGRDAELEHLDRRLERALAGQRQIIFVTGDPGIGKTTLVEAFLERVAPRGDLGLARGQCVEQNAAGEAFMPVLEGLERLCRGPMGSHLVALLREHAPSWLLQLPGLISAADREALKRPHAGVTRRRMLREMVVGIEALTTRTPVVLVLEDLHWSDPSTLDLLVALAQQRGTARLLVVGTYRPVEASIDDHSLDAIGRLLEHREACVEIPLAPLTEAATDEYLRARLADRPIPQGFARALHRRTGGNPLFVAHVTSSLRAESSATTDSPGALAPDLETLLGEMPRSLRGAIEKQIGRVGRQQQRILEAASIAGMEFSAGEVAVALEEDIEAVDACCVALARRGQFLRGLGICEWPDGTAAGRYAFTHALHLEVLLGFVPESVRRRLHQRIGERLEGAYGRRAPEIAVTLASHFARSGDHARAFRYHRYAGEQAIQRNAFTEAAAHLRAALEELANAPDAETRALDELHVQIALGAALSQVEGFAAPEVGAVYARALALSERIGDIPERFVVIGGLEAFYSIRGDLVTGTPLARQLLRLGEESGDPALLIEGHHAMGCNRLRATDLAAARTHLEQGIALYDLERRPDAHRFSGHDPKVCCLGHLGRVLWLGGHPEQARSCAEAALGWAQGLSHPPTLALALTHAAWVHVLRGDHRRVDELASSALSLASEYGLVYWTAIASVQRGWALAELGAESEAVGLLQRGIRSYCGMGAGTHEVAYRALAVQGYTRLGRLDDACRELLDAFDAMERHGERYFEAELHRLEGELLVRSDHGGGVSAPDPTKAERRFRKAIDIARCQQARSLELRAATSLARLLRGQGRHAEARDVLSEVHGWFTEGFDEPDLRQAAALLNVTARAATAV